MLTQQDTAITMGLDIIIDLCSLPIPTELDSTVLFSFCGEDFALSEHRG
ncbi:hypothetical protein SAMN05444920_104772 [Nonomuraea solani]|uniref:Uncharacterized protein n=1 Tax=Nonomuraea solani TaxID=1144553 RepID=A0A1H6D578_9ACTN|nr:hypothetical protein [Nonomuraea solani]SEG79935.1 hypothetical protein SAMN05444920_104772 [Nonomuraea solani]